MKAISVRQPWAYAIERLGKRVENRDWPPRMVPRYRGPLLIHAALGCGKHEFLNAAMVMREIGAIDVISMVPTEDRRRLPDLALLPRGAIVARARLAEVVWTGNCGHRRAPDRFKPGTTCIACGAPMDREGPRCPKADPWATDGALGLILADVEPLAKPIPHKGSLGLFDVPDDVLLRGAA